MTILYWLSDDSKYANNDNHHVLLMTYKGLMKVIGKSDKVARQFHSLTSACAGSKGGRDNANLNLLAMRVLLSFYIRWHFGGGSTDSATDALLETKLTFDGIMEECLAKEPKRALLYGVERRVLVNTCRLVPKF